MDSRPKRSKSRYVDVTRLPTGSKTVFVVMGVLMALGVLMLLKLFRSTPKGFRPDVRMSALDKVQALSLARTARRESEAGRLPEAVLAWQGAIANDPGDPELRRGLLKTLLGPRQPPPRYLNLGLGNAFFLLRLAGTNESDLNLAAQVLSRLGQDNYVMGLLQSSETQLSPDQARAYLKSLFHLQAMDRFGSLWPKYSNSIAGDRDLGLYLTAWQAGWGPPAGLVPALAALESAMTNPATATLARQLNLAVAASRSDLRAYESALDGLVDSQQDRLADHLGYWRLLTRTGRRDRAVELAGAYATPPETPSDAGALADALQALGLRDTAIEFLENQLPVFNFSQEVWQRLGDLYVHQELWFELRSLAVRVRTSNRVPIAQAGLTWFWEGLAELKLGREDTARTAMDQAVEHPPADPLTAFRMATGLQHSGFPDHAARLLKRLESDFSDRAAYWLQVVVAAHDARQFDLMHSAAERGYSLATNNPVFINNYAACLLIQRTNAPLAIELTLRRLTASPNDPGANLNHALALIQNGRLDDAERILNRVAKSELSPSNRTVLEFGRFEVNLRRGNREGAMMAYRRIDLRHLMPPQVRWLEEAYQTLVAPG
ncbi:MAG: tetratricopeptide repeat protein [Verrucomicrobiae bacterium]|nr:tetratricopeptide repeat protein [Verrucomicrobiae bacterium]